jgi:uncharacterized protein YjbI with pentapeptide repeats
MCDYEYESPKRKGEKCPYERGYRRIKWEDKTYCIFHAPIEAKIEKDKIDIFWGNFHHLLELLKNNKDLGEWNFEGFVFPDTGERFIGFVFPKNVKINFGYSKFTGNTNFNETKFLGIVSFMKVIFFSKTNFELVQFFGIANFRGVEFKNEAIFIFTSFSEYANFCNAKFLGKLYFVNSTFSSSAFFTFAKFHDEIHFNSTKFTKETSFGLSEFSSYVNFKEVIFSEDVNFTDAKFQGKTYFNLSIFLKKVTFRITKFYEDVTFNDSKFADLVIFNGTNFGGIADFIETEFSGEVDFSGAKFSDNKTDFSNAKFFCESSFIGTIFLGWTSFIDAKFSSKANFQNIILKNKINLTSAIFNSQADFSGSYISEIEFKGATFFNPIYMGNLGAGSEKVVLKNFVGEGLIEFTRGHLANGDNSKEKPFTFEINNFYQKGVLSVRAPVKKVKIENSNFECPVEIVKEPRDKNSKYFILRLDDVKFFGNVIVKKAIASAIKNCYIGSDFILDECDLKRSTFSGTDLRKIDFINCEWSKKDRRKYKIKWRSSLRNVDALYDEIRSKEILDEKIRIKSDYSKEEKLKQKEDILTELSEMYRAVATSYESRQRYGFAGPFKVGEFEMRRKMRKTGFFEKLFLRLYKLFSSYGESVLKPLAIIICIVFLIPLLFKFCNICYSQAFNINLYACTLYFSTNIKDLPYLIKIVLPFERIFIVIITSLFLFALRRKVKR